MSEAALDGLPDLRDDLAALYRDLHQNPELSLQEKRSADVLAKRLRDAGFDEVTEQVGVTGLVGVLRRGPGPVVMRRAVCDPVLVAEKAGLPYASTARAVDRDGR